MLGRGGDGTIMRFGVTETLINIAHFQKFCIGVNCRRRAKLLRVFDIGSIWPMPHYYFDIKDGHRFVDPSGSDLINPAVDPKRHIAVLNGLREEIFRVSDYSKPSMSSI